MKKAKKTIAFNRKEQAIHLIINTMGNQLRNEIINKFCDVSGIQLLLLKKKKTGMYTYTKNILEITSKKEFFDILKKYVGNKVVILYVEETAEEMEMLDDEEFNYVYAYLSMIDDREIVDSNFIVV